MELATPAPAMAFCPHARHGDMTAIALRKLFGSGLQATTARFQHAHAHDCCYLCKVPYHVALADCPCPHWLVMPASARRAAAPVFATYGLSAVLCFLLLYMQAAGNGVRLSAIDDTGVGLHFDRRCCEFDIAWPDGDAAPGVTMRRATRAKPDQAAAFPAMPADLALLAALHKLAHQGFLAGSLD